MAKKKLTCNVFSQKSIQKLKNDLESYKKETLDKWNRAILKLADEGISVATRTATGHFGSYILFSKKVNYNKYGCTVIVTAVDREKVISEWMLADGSIESRTISPMLFEEFGSGFKASNPLNVSGVGQGTFPDQKHAFEPNGWSWKDVDGNWHTSTGYKPTAPMYHASEEMRLRAEEIIRREFNS